jgi:hypothetical protein
VIRIHDIRIISDDAADVDVGWGEHLECRDWIHLRWVVDDYLGATVLQPSLPTEFATRYGDWVWTLSDAVAQARRGSVAFPLEITSCRKPGVPEPSEAQKALAAQWSRIRRLQGKLLGQLSEEERNRITAELEVLSAGLKELDHDDT